MLCKLNAHSLGVALKHMHLEIGVHTLQARSQAFSDQAIISYRHKGGTRTRNPQRSRTTVQANLPHLIVIGNKFTAIGFLDFVVAGGSDKTNVARLQTARKARDASHLPHSVDRGTS